MPDDVTTESALDAATLKRRRGDRARQAGKRQRDRAKRRKSLTSAALAAYRGSPASPDYTLGLPHQSEWRITDKGQLQLWLCCFPRWLADYRARLESLGYHPVPMYHCRLVLSEPLDLVRAASTWGDVRESLVKYCLLVRRSPKHRHRRRFANDVLRDYYGPEVVAPK